MINQVFRLKDILYSVRKHMNMIITLTLGGLLVGIAFYAIQSLSLSDQTMYKVFVSFSIDASNESGYYYNANGSPGETDFKLASTLVEWVTYIARSELVCKTAVERLGLIGVTTKTIQNALSVNTYGDTSIMELVLVWKDADEGVLMMEAIMDILPDAVRSVLNIGNINLIEGPVVTTISTPVGMKSVILFPALGFLASMMYCFVQMYMHPTLIDIKDVGEMFGLNTLSVIDDDPDFDDFIGENLVTNRENLSSVLKDDFTAFAHILLHQIDDDYFSMFVTSSVRGEGRTMIVANLGVALAALGKRVLLIDFDLTSPTLGSFFMDEVNYENTINAVYFDDVSVDDALVRVNPNLYLLTARLDKRPIGIDLFAKKLVARLESEFDVLIMDTPPVGENSDTLYFSSISQNALYVIRHDYAVCDLISENIEKLNKAGMSLLGAVVNRVPTTTSQLGVGRISSDATERETVISRILQKLPFSKKKTAAPEKPRRRFKAADANGFDESDSYDSDDDLIDTEDYDLFLNNAGPADEAPAEQIPSLRRRKTAVLSDDSDDELFARMDGRMTGLYGNNTGSASDPEGPPAAEPSEYEFGGAEEAVPLPAGSLSSEEVDDRAGTPAPKPMDGAAYEEDEDARFARIFSTQINHFDRNDDGP